MPAHAEKRDLPYSARQMFDLVADVAAYPEFLPWTAAARIRSVEARDNGSKQTIESEYLDGPFKYLRSNRQFTDLEKGGCEAAFDVEFAFKNKLLQGTAELFFYEAMRRIVRAFETRAHALHGELSQGTA